MLDAHLHRDLHEGARFDGVVVVVAERIGDELRHHDRAGEVQDGLHRVLAHDRAHQLLIAHVANDQRGVCRDRPAEARRKIVEDDDAFPGIEKLEHHVASDVSGSAGDEYTHRLRLPDIGLTGLGRLASQSLTMA